MIVVSDTSPLNYLLALGQVAGSKSAPTLNFQLSTCSASGSGKKYKQCCGE